MRGWRPAAAGDDRVRDIAAIGVIRPGALHRERTGGEGHQCGGALAGADPCALVPVLLSGERRAGVVDPSARRILVGEGFGIFMAAYDGAPVERVPDEVRTATATQVGDIRHVGKGDIAVL